MSNNNKLMVITKELTTAGFYNITTLAEATALFNSLEIANYNLEKARAWILRKVSVDKLYTNTAYRGVGDYASQKFGFTKGNTSIYVKGAVFLANPIYSIFANMDTGEDFTITQLSVLANLKEEEVWNLINNGKITYKTSVNDLKKVVFPDKAKVQAEEAEKKNIKEAASYVGYGYIDTIVNGVQKADKTFKKDTIYTFEQIEECVNKLVRAWNNGKERVFLFTYDIETNITKVHQFTNNNNK